MGIEHAQSQVVSSHLTYSEVGGVSREGGGEGLTGQKSVSWGGVEGGGKGRWGREREGGKERGI